MMSLPAWCVFVRLRFLHHVVPCSYILDLSVNNCSTTTVIIYQSVHLQMKEAIMNQEKLAKLQAQVRIGGKVKSCQYTQCFGTLCSFLKVPSVFVFFCFT